MPKTYCSDKKKESVVSKISIKEGDWSSKIVQSQKGKPELLQKNHTVTVHYNPTVFIKQEFLIDTLQDNRAVDAVTQKQIASRRSMTKHRLVTSTVTGNRTASGSSTKPYKMVVTTVVTPRFDGLSPVDEQMFCSVDAHGGKLCFSKLSNPPISFADEYSKLLKLIYKRCIYAQLSQNVNTLIIPPLVGLGTSLSRLCESAQNIALEMNYAALLYAMQEIQTGKNQWQGLKKFKEVICVLPNNNDHISLFAEKYMNQYSGSIPITLIKADPLELAQKLDMQEYRVGLLNPGEDCKIENVSTKNKIHLSPVEQQLEQSTNLVEIQTVKIGGRCDRFHLVAFPPALSPTNIWEGFTPEFADDSPKEITFQDNKGNHCTVSGSCVFKVTDKDRLIQAIRIWVGEDQLSGIIQIIDNSPCEAQSRIEFSDANDYLQFLYTYLPYNGTFSDVPLTDISKKTAEFLASIKSGKRQSRECDLQFLEEDKQYYRLAHSELYALQQYLLVGAGLQSLIKSSAQPDNNKDEKHIALSTDEKSASSVTLNEAVMRVLEDANDYYRAINANKFSLRHGAKGIRRSNSIDVAIRDEKKDFQSRMSTICMLIQQSGCSKTSLSFFMLQSLKQNLTLLEQIDNNLALSVKGLNASGLFAYSKRRAMVAEFINKLSSNSKLQGNNSSIAESALQLGNKLLRSYK